MDISSTIVATTIFIFFLLPGFIFLRTIWASDRGPLSASNFYHYFIWGALCSVLIYMLGFTLSWIFNALLNLLPKDSFSFAGIELPQFHGLLLSVKECSYLLKPTETNSYVYHIMCLGIFSLLCDALAYILAYWSKNYILENEIDLKYEFFRFKNDWFYITTGRKPGRSSVTEAHLLHEIGGAPVLYKGVVDDYILKDEQLEFLILTNVFRTGFLEWEKHFESNNELSDDAKLSANVNTNPEFYPLSQEATVIFKASEIKNLQINYGTNAKLVPPSEIENQPNKKSRQKFRFAALLPVFVRR